jgi:glycine/D-amino acid oxidase-like deaminating enzyme
MIDQADVVVIGAGAFGSSTAYHLAKLGVRNVILVDKFELGSQTSPRAAGLTSQVRATDGLTRLAQRAVRKLERFAVETGQPLRFDQSGALKIARTEEHVAQLHREVARGKQVGVEIDFITPAAARETMPFLVDKGILAMTYSATDCNVEPSQLPVGYARAAEELGVVTLPNTAVSGLRIGPGGVEKVVTSRGEIRTEAVVDAAGAWSRLVAELAGARLPVVPTRHQLFITEPIAGATPSMPIARVIDANVYVRHERGGLMLGGYESNPRQLDMRELGTDFQVRDLELDVEVLWGLARSVEDQFPVFQQPWVKIAEHRGVRGFWLLSGCCVGGLSISPALGEAVAQWIVGGEPELDCSEITLERFAGRELPEDELRELCRRAYATHYTASGGHPEVQ